MLESSSTYTLCTYASNIYPTMTCSFFTCMPYLSTLVIYVYLINLLTFIYAGD